ncbi:hypothetical protein [Neorhizobium sp. DT-125]|uniref:hypothetical protein n=1 Tax=Neorhizobium sp. DT-125 TaxID=3396163 RepID=UPI003F1B5AB8
MSRSILLVPDEEIKAALLEAAGMIRALKIVLDAKDDGTGGHTFDGMEARVAELKSDIGNIKDVSSETKHDVRDLRSGARTDFRLLFGALIAAAIGLAASWLLVLAGFSSRSPCCDSPLRRPSISAEKSG